MAQFSFQPGAVFTAVVGGVAFVVMAALGPMTAIRLRMRSRSGGTIVEARLILGTLARAAPVLLVSISEFLMHLFSRVLYVGVVVLVVSRTSRCIEDVASIVGPPVLVVTRPQVRELSADFVCCKRYPSPPASVPNGGPKPDKRSNKPNV